MDQNLDTVVESGDRVGANIGAFGCCDDAPRAGDFQGMGDCWRAKVGADKRDNQPCLDEPEPDCKILGPIPHHEGDGLAPHDARA